MDDDPRELGEQPYINLLVDANSPAPTPDHTLTGDFAFIRAASWINLQPIQPLFDALPRDDYVAEGFRYKTLSRVTVAGDSLEIGDHGPLFQSKDYNPTQGDIIRSYEPIAEPLLSALRDAIKLYWTCARLRTTDEVLVQAQRITATAGDDGTSGLPAVEGFHQDNVNIVGLFVVSRVNIRGGISILSYTNGVDDVGFAGVLEPGDLLLFNDRVMWHYTSPIYQLREGELGYRDVVLFGWPSSRIEEW